MSQACDCAVCKIWREHHAAEAESVKRANYYIDRVEELREQLQTIRQDTLEECARIAETEGISPPLNVHNGGPEWFKHACRIATAIRNLGKE